MNDQCHDCKIRKLCYLEEPEEDWTCDHYEPCEYDEEDATDINVGGKDTISRKAAVDALGDYMIGKRCPEDGTLTARLIENEVINKLPPAQPEQHIDADGTLWITVTDIERVKRVIVDEEKSKFCKQFYMDAQSQRTGKWIPQDHNKRVGNISTCVYYYPICSECGQVGNDTYKYCPHCGAKMEGAKNESD